LRYKYVDICDILIENYADVFFIGETKLDESFTNNQFYVKNFSIYRKDRNAHGGGVMAYVNSSVAHRIRNDINAVIVDGLEGLVIELLINKNKWLVAGLYKPPSMDENVFYDCFCKLADVMFSETTNVIFTGDLNYNMNRTNRLSDLCEVYGLYNKIEGNTCHTKDSSTALDVFLVSNVRKFGTSLNANIGVSDVHNIIGCAMRVKMPKTGPKLVKYRSYKKFSLDVFQNDLSRLPTNYSQNHCNIDEHMDIFYAQYKSVVDKHVPVKSKFIKKMSVPYMNGELRHAIFRKCMLRNKYYKQRSTLNWSNYKKQRNHVTKLRKKSIKTYFQNKCKNGKNNYDFWRTIKPFMSDKYNNESNTIILREGTDIITDPEKICSIFNNHFTNVAQDIGFEDQIPCHIDNSEITPYVLEKHGNHSSIIKIKQHVSSRNCFSFQQTNENDVLKVLKEIDVTKATGCDNLPPRIIKYSISYLVPILTLLINKCVDECVFPMQLKLAEISSIFKKKDRLEKENYRPVSILVVLSKIFEKIYSIQVERYFATIFHPFLSAYRKHYGCHDVLLRMIEDWKRALDNNMFSGALLMDLSKAFDCLPHALVICKLHAYGFSHQACQLVASYLQDRQQRVKLGSYRSSWSPLTKGVPQGSIFGPLIFNIFINDLFYHIDKCSMFNYADDNTLFYSHERIDNLLHVLKSDVETVVTWFECNGMQANPEKFQLIVSHRHKNDIVELQVCNTVIKSSDHVKLLGVTIDRKLNFDTHISELCKKASRQVNVLKRLSNMLTLNVKLAILNSFVLSNFKYCPIVWHFCKRRKMRMIEKVHERALRTIYGNINLSYSELLNLSKRKTLHYERLRLIAIQVYKSVNGLSPPYVNNLFSVKDNVYSLRNKVSLVQPIVSTVNYGILSVSYHGPKVWNTLPEYIKEADTLGAFKSRLYKWTEPLCNCSSCVDII
jgi:hypothetical protein